MSKLITIERHISEMQRDFPQATGSFTALLQDIALAAKLISKETNRAGLVDILGAADTENVFGEQQKKLDLFADQTIYRVNDHTGRLCAMVSEEHETILTIPDEYPVGNYVLAYDPLDGSSNIDINASIGTIFSIHRRFSKGRDGTEEDVLQEGKRLAAAGYVIYGSSTMMVYTTGLGVYGFTLDPSIGEFVLSHDNLKIPDVCPYYSINHGNQKYWTEGIKRYVNWMQGLDDDDNEPMASRYIGALIADFHRNLLKGGVYIYPSDTREERAHGKIRLIHEAQAMAFIAQQAGGYASDGIGDLLDLRPHDIHQVTPIIIGNKDVVERGEQFIKEHDADWLKFHEEYRSREHTAAAD